MHLSGDQALTSPEDREREVVDALYRLGPALRPVVAEAAEAADPEERAAAVRELRKVRRHLHDDAQPRLMALTISLGAAEAALLTDPGKAHKLLAEARETSLSMLGELRGVLRDTCPQPRPARWFSRLRRRSGPSAYAAGSHAGRR